jgi:hypothetical protein
MTIKVIPEVNVPIPKDLSPEQVEDLLTRTKVAFNTASFLIANGLDADPRKDTQATRAAAKEAAKQFTGSPTAGRRPYNAKTAIWLKDLFYRYNNDVVEDTIKLKNYVVTRLVEESDGDKATDRLRALEDLGKMSQIGLFSDKIEVSVNNKSTEELKQDLAKKLARYMGAVDEVKEEKPKKKTMVIDLNKELGTKNKEEQEVRADD